MVKRILVLLCVLSLSSCIIIEEEIIFKTKESGTYIFKMDGSQSKTIFKAAVQNFLKASGEDMTLDDALEEAEADMQKRINTGFVSDGVDGLSNPVGFVNLENASFEIRFDFANFEALNKAFVKMHRTQEKKGGDTYPSWVNYYSKNTFLEYSNTQLIVTSTAIIKTFERIIQDSILKGQASMMYMMGMGDARYKITIIPSEKVTGFTSERYTLNGEKLVLDESFESLFTNFETGSDGNGKTLSQPFQSILRNQISLK